MRFPGRRVVTGHDANGRAIVQFDNIPANIISRRTGHASAVLWTTDSCPANNTGRSDDALHQVDRSVANGTVFRVAKLDPGVASARHRTDSIDYIVILSGEIDMELDGTEVHLKAGDFMVQRGTVHNWVNRGTEPCVYAVILIGAMPVPTAAAV